MNKKGTIAGGLLAGAFLWVLVLHLMFSGGGEPTSEPAEDGSKAIIKYLDKSRFYEQDAGRISLRMDILDGSQKPILGLTKESVEVAEEKIPAEVIEFKGPGTQPINVILVIDISGSMRDEGKIQGAIDAALAAVDELKVDRDRLGIIAFDDRFDIVQPLARLTSATKLSCQQRIRVLAPRGGTIIGVPTLEALNIFERQNPDGPKVLMVMTDGQDDTLRGMEGTIVQASDKTGVPVYTIGFGQQRAPDAEAVLRALAEKCNAQYKPAPTPQELADIYRAQVQELTNEFTVVYNSPYPKADGLKRQVEVKVSAPAGALAAGAQYDIGSIVDSGGSRAAPASGAAPSALATVASAALKLILFVVLFAMLAAALAAPTFLGIGKRSSDSETSTSASPSGAKTSAPARAPPSAAPGRPPPPPPAAKKPAKPATPPAAEKAGSEDQGSAGTSTSTSRPAPKLSGKPGEKKTIRPVPPPPPRPPGSGS